MTRPDPDTEARIPLSAWGATNGHFSSDDDDDADLTSAGLISSTLPPPAVSSSYPSGTTSPSDPLWARFVSLWRRIPQSWSLERDPRIAARHLLTLFAFLSLCTFVFLVPALLYVASPRAPTPPGTAPALDEAASAVSGRHAAVAADTPRCSELGLAVLRDAAGNAVDAAVAAVLCQGVLAPFASGLGGGALILVHRQSDAVTRYYDAREAAPAAADMSMFANATSPKFGGTAVAVPGELRGLYLAHKEMGRLPWKAVVEPVIQVAKTATVGPFLAIKLKQMNETVLSSPSLRAIFTKRVLTKKAQNQQNAEASVELPGMRRDQIPATVEDEHWDATAAAARGVVETLEGNAVVPDANDKDQHGVSVDKGAEDDKNGTYTVELLEEGDRIQNDALVRTLQSIAEKGPDALYVDLADKLAHEVRDAGGVMTAADIKGYKAARRQPIFSSYQGFSVVGAGLPSAGGTCIAMALNVIRELQFRKKGRNGVSYELLAETLKWVFGASMGLGDSSFVGTAQRQVWKMLSRREAIKRAFRIEHDRGRTFKPRHYTSKVSSSRLEGGTSHVSIIDANGTAVSVTSTINLPFGAGLVSNCSGILLNDEMDAFTTSGTRVNAYGVYPSRENSVEGGKRPISSMSPTILLRDDLVYMALGGSGGPKAISSVLQTILNVVDYGDSLADAISAPRLHHQLVPNEISLEGANGTSCAASHALKRPSSAGSGGGGGDWTYWESVCKALKDVGHRTQGPAVHGAVQAVIRPGVLVHYQRRREGEDEAELHRTYAASDPRRIGKAAAY